MVQHLKQFNAHDPEHFAPFGLRVLGTSTYLFLGEGGLVAIVGSIPTQIFSFFWVFFSKLGYFLSIVFLGIFLQHLVLCGSHLVVCVWFLLIKGHTDTCSYGKKRWTC